MTLVLDTSMALSWQFERVTAAERDCAARALDALASAPVFVPSLWQTEVANAMLVAERLQLINAQQSGEFLRRLDQLPIRVDPASTPLHRNAVLTLARQHGLTAYDAVYLELALRLGASLVTFDGKLAAAMQAAGGAVFA